MRLMGLLHDVLPSFKAGLVSLPVPSFHTLSLDSGVPEQIPSGLPSAEVTGMTIRVRRGLPGPSASVKLDVFIPPPSLPLTYSILPIVEASSPFQIEICVHAVRRPVWTSRGP